MAKRRRRGDGSLHLRKDGRWEGRYVVGRDEKGFPITKNVLAKTKAECAAKLEQLRESLEVPTRRMPAVRMASVQGGWRPVWQPRRTTPRRP